MGISERGCKGVGGVPWLTGDASACIALHLSPSSAGFFFSASAPVHSYLAFPGLGARARFSWNERGARARVQPAGHSCTHAPRGRSPPPALAGSGWVARRSLRHLSPRPIDVRRAFFPRIRTKKREDKKVRERHYPCCRGPIAIRKEAFFMGDATHTPAPVLLSLTLSLSHGRRSVCVCVCVIKIDLSLFLHARPAITA